jgi:hypothetical protein
MSSTSDDDLGPGVDSSTTADYRQEDDLLREAILNALVADIGVDGSTPSEQHQLLRQTIFKALKHDLNPSSSRSIDMVQVDDNDAASTADSAADRVEALDTKQVEVTTAQSSRIHMYKSSLEDMKEKIMSPPPPATKKRLSLSPSPSLVALEASVLAKSRDRNGGMGVGAHAVDSSLNASFSSMTTSTSSTRIARIARLEADVLQKSRSSAVARAPSRSQSKEEDRVSMGIGAYYAITGPSTCAGDELAAGDLNRLESDALEKSQDNLSFRTKSSPSLMFSAAGSLERKAASTKSLCDDGAYVARQSDGSSTKEDDDVETARGGGTSAFATENNHDYQNLPIEDGVAHMQDRASGERPSWASSSQELNVSDPNLPLREGSIVVASHVVEEPVLIVARATTVNPHRKYYKWIFLAAGALSAALIVGLSVGLTQHDSNNSPPIDVCLDRPDVFTQCGCNNSIYFLSGSLVSGYDNITRTLIRTGINVNTSITMNSCHPSVVSRIWLADQNPSNRVDLHQKYALSVFYLALNGKEWSTNWLLNSSSTDVCNEWSGIICTSASVVSEIQLVSGNLRGQIPSELAILSDTLAMEVNNNQITGTLPSELATMSLGWLGVEENELVGPFQPTLLPSTITSLRLNANRLTGTIPTETASLSRLRRLQLNGNMMTGTLPTEIARLSSLLVLHLSENNFVGTAPEEYESLENLEELLFSNNSLTGSLPLAYTKLTKIITMEIANNNFTGTVPESYCTSFEALAELVGDCNANFSANCTCCTCWKPGLELDVRP